MSDIPTDATGVHVIGTHAYLYNRNGTYIADHALADGVLAAAHLQRNMTDPRDAAARWLDAIGYRATGDDWTEHHGWLRAVEWIGPVAFDWDRTEPGHYVGTYAARRATVNRTREGMIGANEVMWVVRVDGRHLTNAATVDEGKRIADTELRRTVDVVVPDPEEPANVDLHAPAAGPA